MGMHLALEPAMSSDPATLSALPGLLACEQCDALYTRVRLGSGQQARCTRCGSLLGRGHRISLQGMVALTLAAAVTFVIANVQPVAHLNFGGVRSDTTLPQALMDTWDAGEPLIALLAGAVTVLFPALVLLLRLYVLAPLAGRGWPPFWRQAMHALQRASRWSMVEVLMLSAMVAIVRLAGMASVVPDVGLYAFGVLALLLAALDTCGLHRLWWLIDPERGLVAEPPEPADAR
jgi:paraquat-inducible protein A